MEFSSSPKHHHHYPVRTKSKKNPSIAPTRARPEAPIQTSFVNQTSILPCKTSEKAAGNVSGVRSPFVFGASSQSGTDRVVFNGDKESKNGGEEEASSSFDFESYPLESGTDTCNSTGTENDGLVFSERSRESEFSSNSGYNLKEGLLPKVTKEVRKLKMDEKTENGSGSSDLPMNNERFVFGKSVEKEKMDNYSNEILGSNISPDFAFGSKSSGIGLETPQKEIKMTRNGDKRIQKKGEIRKNQRGKKIGASSSFVNDYEPMDYSPYEEVLINAENNNNNDNNYEAGNNISELKYSENLAKDNFNTEKNVFGEEKDSNLNSENLETTNLDSKIDAKTNESGTLFSSAGQINVNNFSFSTSKNSNSDHITAKKHNRKKNYKSRLGPSIYTAKNVYINQANNNSDIAFNPQISPNINFESKNKSSINSNKETVGTEEDCEKWRARGNQAYEKGDMKAAEEFYTIGINSLSPDSKNRALMLCYSNRAASRISLGKIREALNDCLIASNIDSSFSKVKLRAANCFLALGDFEEAIKYYNKCLESNSDPKIYSEASNGLEKSKKVSELMNQAEEIIQKGKSDELSKALEIISEASVGTHSDKLMKMKAEILLTLGRYEDAIKLCEKNLYENEKDFDAQIWRYNIISKSYFYLGKLDEALEAWRKKERATVDSSRRRESEWTDSDSAFLVTVQELIRLKTTGNESFQAGKYTSAIDHYTSAINLSPESRNFTAICLCNRAAAFQALGQIVDAIADCSLAVALHSGYAKAISRRATLYEMIRDYTQAANDLQTLISLLEKNNRIQENHIIKTNNNISDDLDRVRQRLLSAEEEAKKDAPLNLYLILGVEPLSSVNDVKKAYRKAALRHHPDKAGQFLLRNENISEAFHKDADHLFKIIGEAYNVLSDSTKRMKYDNDEQKRASKKKGSTR